jgi:hypothetical protein
MAISNSARTMLTAPSLYYSGPAAILGQTNGLVFAIQPDIVYNQSVNYTPYNLTHTNYTTHAYSGTPSPTIQVTAQFSNVTRDEHLYTQGVIHFLRSVTKMFYGFGDQNNSPIVYVGNVSIPYQSDTDLVEVNGQSLPAIQTIALDLLVSVNPAKQKREFSKSGFVSGNLYSKGFI